MNILAHICLSGDNQDILLGNIIGDFVKGKQHLQYPLKIQEGIKLHRHIDNFTDNHKIVIELGRLFKPQLRHYSGIATDIIFDHILAKNWNLTSNLDVFSNDFYQFVNLQLNQLPYKAQFFFKNMERYDWLKMYKDKNGIETILFQMSKRSKFDNNLDLSYNIYNDHQTLIDESFTEFWKLINQEILNTFGYNLLYFRNHSSK